MKKLRRLLSAVLLVLVAVMMCSTATAEKQYELVEITDVPSAALIQRLYATRSTMTEAKVQSLADEAIAIVSSLDQLPETGTVNVLYVRYTNDTLGDGYYVLTYMFGQLFTAFGTHSQMQESDIPGFGNLGQRIFLLVEKEVPDTGDATPIALLSVLLAGSAAGIIALRRRQAQGA